MLEYASLALELADRGSAVLAGPEGNGVFDGFNDTSLVDLGTAVNLDTSYAGELRPAAVTSTIGSATPTTAADYSAFTMVDRSVALANNKPVSHLGVYSSVARSVTLKIVHLVSGADAVVFSQTFSHPGGGQALFALSTPYNVPASGSFHVGIKYPSGNIECASMTRAYYTGDATGTVSFTEDGGNCPCLSATQLTGASLNLTVDTVQINTPVAPTVALVTLFARPEDGAMNTDMAVKVTRDGIDWQTLTMTFANYRHDGSACYISGEVDISGLDTGTACKCRWQTLNGKSPRLLARGVVFGVSGS